MGALEIDLALGVEAVVELAAVEVMAERVEMGGREAVGLDREIIGASERAERMADMAGANHQVRYGHRVVASGYGRQRQGERDGFAGFDEAGGGGAFFIGDEIERTALVVLAPASPVADLFHEFGDLSGRVLRGHWEFSAVRGLVIECVAFFGWERMSWGGGRRGVIVARDGAGVHPPRSGRTQPMWPSPG